jgi:uncharacterized membrane protein
MKRDVHDRSGGDVRPMERIVARVLTAGIVAGFSLLVVGLVTMVAWNIGPLDRPWPSFDPGRLATDLQGLRPSGFLWLGLLVVVLTPAARVVASAVGFAAQGDRSMVAVSVAIVSVIVLGVILGATG